MTGSFAAPPATEEELLARARRLAGQRLGEVARSVGVEPPADLRRAKGFTGQLLERVLGATARSRAAPDFEELGIELKTLPVGPGGVPVESTFVCTIDPRAIGDVEWETSLVRAKLARVLFLPVEGERRIPVAERRLGTALLWTPSSEQEAALRADWEELAGILGRGELDGVTGHMGTWLQVRPKAEHSRARRRGTERDGTPVATLPRGFYLRARFTAALLAEHFALGPDVGRSGRRGRLSAERSPDVRDRDDRHHHRE
ncbi:MAG: DNA mismatch repair endonuclease MutH [Deltaproteobacteria bacterium]|nr:DNA mismatch repair endonuclease MutH [Deltaproteobacteria bacterium]